MTSTPPSTERERQLEQDLSDLTAMYETCCRERIALAAQVEVMRSALEGMVGVTSKEDLLTMKQTLLALPMPPEERDITIKAVDALLVQGISTEILRKRDAKTLREAVKRFIHKNWTGAYELELMAAELEGETK